MTTNGVVLLEDSTPSSFEDEDKSHLIHYPLTTSPIISRHLIKQRQAKFMQVTPQTIHSFTGAGVGASLFLPSMITLNKGESKKSAINYLFLLDQLQSLQNKPSSSQVHTEKEKSLE